MRLSGHSDGQHRVIGKIAELYEPEGQPAYVIVYQIERCVVFDNHPWEVLVIKQIIEFNQ